MGRPVPAPAGTAGRGGLEPDPLKPKRLGIDLTRQICRGASHLLRMASASCAEKKCPTKLEFNTWSTCASVNLTAETAS
jgi:hypothetical protein